MTTFTIVGRRHVIQDDIPAWYTSKQSNRFYKNVGLTLRKKETVLSDRVCQTVFFLPEKVRGVFFYFTFSVTDTLIYIYSDIHKHAQRNVSPGDAFHRQHVLIALYLMGKPPCGSDMLNRGFNIHWFS